MVQVVRVPDTAPVIVGVVTPPSDQTLVATAFTPPDSPDPTVLSVVMPAGGTPPGGGGIDPEFVEEVDQRFDTLEARVATIETAPAPPPTGPAGGALAGAYPNPTLAQSYALSGPTTTALSAKAPRRSVRAVTTDTTAQPGELLRVGTGTSTVTVNPPLNPQAGDQIEILKVDVGTGKVVFNGDTNSDATCEFQGQWAGATLVYTNPTWVVTAVAVSYSAPPSQAGGGSSNLNREQADARYDPLGAATAAVAGFTKSSLGLGNVDNTADVNKPISIAVQTALNAKAPLAAPYLQTGSGTYTVNASNGNIQAITATGNLVLAPPTFGSDMQSLRLEVYAQPGSNKTVTTTGTISNASNQVLPFTVPSGRNAILGLVYSARTTRWMLMSYVVEPGS